MANSIAAAILSKYQNSSWLRYRAFRRQEVGYLCYLFHGARTHSQELCRLAQSQRPKKTTPTPTVQLISVGGESYS